MTTPEQTFHRLLGLDECWNVTSLEYKEAENIFRIGVEETSKLWAKETQRLGQTVTGYDHVEPMEWRHLNVFSKECVIVCRLPRGCRANDKTVYRVTPPWEGRSKHFTDEFEAFALTLIKEMPVKKAGEILKETDQRLWRMVMAHVQAAYAQLSMEDVVSIGADEMNRRKGHNYLTVFADLMARRVLFATEGKDAATWQAFVNELIKHNGHPKAITQVAIDMSRAYIKGVEDNLGNAEITFDKFHIIQQVVDAICQVRRLEAQSDPLAGQLLAKTQWIWNKNPENWTEKEGTRWEQLHKEHLATGTAYQMRLVLQDIYKLACPEKAKQKFLDWCQWVRNAAVNGASTLLAPMVDVAKMIESHLEGILGHWTSGLTTAFLEGLNSLFSATKRKARGYRTTKYMIAMLYFVAGKLTIPCYTH
jgi:transposase